MRIRKILDYKPAGLCIIELRLSVSETRKEWNLSFQQEEQELSFFPISNKEWKNFLHKKKKKTRIVNALTLSYVTVYRAFGAYFICYCGPGFVSSLEPQYWNDILLVNGTLNGTVCFSIIINILRLVCILTSLCINAVLCPYTFQVNI